MNRFLLLAFAFLMISLQGFSQNDPKAKAILDKVSAKVKQLKSLKAAFTLSIKNGKTSKVESKNGTVSMKGTKYYVKLANQEIFCDNKTIWTYMKESNEVQISSFDPNENTFTPSKLFTNFYDKEYTYQYAGEKTFAGKKVDVIILMPTNKAKNFSKVELMIDKAQSVVAGGAMYEKNGNVINYTVSGYSPNPTLSDALFVFDVKKYPKVEVVDLR